MSEDRALFDAWRRGDASAGEQLFERYYVPLARFFRNKVDDAAATDLLQATFLACAEGRDGYRGGNIRSYLFAIAHNLLREHFRRRARQDQVLDFAELSVADLGPTASERIRGRQEQRLLLEALRNIPLDCQEVLELHYWEQLGVAEIAEIVGAPVGTVKSRLRRGRERLETELERLASSPELLASTLHGLDDWAAEIRDRMGF